MVAKGVSSPRALAIPIAIAVLPAEVEPPGTKLGAQQGAQRSAEAFPRTHPLTSARGTALLPFWCNTKYSSRPRPGAGRSAPVPGCPASRMARPAILPSRMRLKICNSSGGQRSGAKKNAEHPVSRPKALEFPALRLRTSPRIHGLYHPNRGGLRTTPAARRAFCWPTIPWLTLRGSSASSKPSPRMWLCAPMRSMRVRSFTSATFTPCPSILTPQHAPRPCRRVTPALLRPCIGPLGTRGAARGAPSRAPNTGGWAEW